MGIVNIIHYSYIRHVMAHKKLTVLGAAAALLLAGCAQMPSMEERIDSILSQMTLEEKVGIIHAQSKFSSYGVPRLGIPELWTDDGPHGVRPETFWDAWAAAGWTDDSVTAYPSLTCLAATWDREIAGLYGKSVGEEARYRRKNVLLGPGVNIMRTPLCGRNFEYMGEDPFLAGEMCAPYIRGLQSNGVAACVKHYCLNNHEVNRHTVNVNVSDRALHEIYLPAFKKAVQEGGAWSVMGAYNLYKGEHLCHNDVTINQILKKDWGFDGALISDWGGTHDTDEAVRNGLDIEFGTGTNGVDKNVENAYDYYYLAKPYLEGLKSGKYDIAGLDEKCRRVLRLMMRTSMGENRSLGSLNSPEHWADARKIGGSGIVLLKNKDKLLPIKGTPAKVVVLGENAIKPMAVGGQSSSLKAQHETSVLEGIRAALPGAEVVYERAYQGAPKIYGYNYSKYDLTDPRTAEQLLSDALAAVEGADYVIFVGGLNKSELQDCESVDRVDYHLPYGQDEVIAKLAQARPDMIYVNVSGSPVAMPFADKVGAILQAWYLGSETGNALADVLTGKVNPSGKLPCTFPRELADCPVTTEAQYPGILGEDGISQCDYSEGIYVGYRWYEAKNIEPLFAFGYGLSYTQFEYGQAKAASTMGKTLKISVPVRNTGDVAGAEVVQLYISAKNSSVDRPVKELKGFEKVWLQPGEQKTVVFEIGEDAVSYYDEQAGKWVAEKGEYQALVAAASDDVRSTVKFTKK